MTWPQALAYGVIQGVTEFLPVSSSAHLALLPWLAGWKDPGLSFDVALHVGTLAAVLAYFWRDWWELLSGACAAPLSDRGKFLALLVMATIPAGLAGIALEPLAESWFRAPPLTAAALIVFALWLEWADRSGEKNKGLKDIGVRQALLIGLSQALAIVPGVSRSGVTITAGLIEGLNAESAARFSFLLSTPIVVGAAAHQCRHLRAADLDAAFLVGVASSALTGLCAVTWLMRSLRTRPFRAYVLYRLALGITILGLYFGRGG